MPPRCSHNARTVQARGELQRWPPLAGPGALGCAAREPSGGGTRTPAPPHPATRIFLAPGIVVDVRAGWCVVV